MKRWLVCYANRRYAAAQRWLVESGHQFRFDEIRSFQESDLLRTEFFRNHRTILSAKRGGGYWLWKPYFIAQMLQEAAPDDIIVYADSGIEIIADLHPLIEICAAGFGPMLFQIYGHRNIVWTKRDCLVGMKCDLPRFHQACQVSAAFQLYRKCEASLEFVRTWLDFCCQEQLLTDVPNQCGLENYPEFLDHRHDQSILSLLAERWQLPIYRDPSQWGNARALPEFRPGGTPPIDSEFVYLNSPYGQLLDHHRRCRTARKRHRYDGIRHAVLKMRPFTGWRQAA